MIGRLIRALGWPTVLAIVGAIVVLWVVFELLRRRSAARGGGSWSSRRARTVTNFDRILGDDDGEMQAYLDKAQARSARIEVATTPEALVALLADEDMRESVVPALRKRGPGSAAALADAIARWSGGDANPAAAASAIGVLAEVGDASRLDALALLVRHEAAKVREAAARALAESGRARFAAEVALALGDAEKDVAEDAITGLGSALKAGRLEPALGAAAFPHLVRLAGTEVGFFRDTPARLLLAIDRERGGAALSTREMLAPGRPGLRHTLDALNDAGISIAAETAWALVGAAAGDSGSLREASLLALALSRHPKAAALVEEELRSKDEKRRRAAVPALCAVLGIADPVDHVVARPSGAALTEAEQRVLDVFHYTGQVGNGGHEQFFFNSTGDRARESLAALRSVGATELAAVLAEAMSFFGKDGPPTDRDARIAALEAMGRRQRVRLAALDERCWELDDDLPLLLARHVRDCPEFRRK